MNKWIKLIALSALTLVVLPVVLVSLGSIDAPSHDDRGLLDSFDEVDDLKNGFSEIAFTQAGTDLIDYESGTEVLLEHIEGEEWDAEFVASTLDENEEYIQGAINSLSYAFIKLPAGEDVYDLPAYVPIINLSRLLILISMNEARNQNFDKAITYLRYAIIFSQKIKAESNNYLISHMIGLVMQYESLVWLNSFISLYELEAEQYLILQLALDEFLSYPEDGFHEVFSGEYKFSEGMIDGILNRPLTVRWEEYRSNTSIWYMESQSESGDVFSKHKLFDFLFTLFPKFYLHKNKILSEAAKDYSFLSEQTNKYCVEHSFSSEKIPSLKWLDLIRPNSISSQWTADLSMFQGYFNRRCFAHAHIEASKGLVAIKYYQSEIGSKPSSIEQLIPEYLQELPLDPFDGGWIKYSADQNLLYSAGNNFVDDGGAAEASFVKRCFEHCQCASNPSFLIH